MCSVDASQIVQLFILCLGKSIVYTWEKQRINLYQFYSYVYWVLWLWKCNSYVSGSGM